MRHRSRRLAFDDPKAIVVTGLDRRGVDTEDPGQGRGLCHQACLESVTAAHGALDLDDDTFGVVADVAGQAELGGQTVDERSEADALHHARYPDPVSHRHS